MEVKRRWSKDRKFAAFGCICTFHRKILHIFESPYEKKLKRLHSLGMHPEIKFSNFEVILFCIVILITQSVCRAMAWPFFWNIEKELRNCWDLLWIRIMTPSFGISSVSLWIYFLPLPSSLQWNKEIPLMNLK